MERTEPHLKRTLSTVQLWGIAVGLVISGEYFGWSYGWAAAGTLGFVVSTAFVALMYVTFIFSYTELTTSIPHSGGPFAYARAAFGPGAGFLAGAATLIEFVFAPPAIALAIGSYLNVQFPGLDPRTAACGAYVIFMGLNIVGVELAATVELFVTILAIFELLVFMGVVAPGFHAASFLKGGWSGRDAFSLQAVPGMFAALPFAIWFFLGIEGVAMAAEETRNPRRSIPIAYVAGISTLLVLAAGVMVFAGAAGDWTRLSNINDPLPQAMRFIVGDRSGWLHMLVWLGLLGLVASFHGIILGYSRQIYALARAGYLPRYFSRLHPQFKTPHRAILAGGVVGIAAIYSDNLLAAGGASLTANIVTLSVFGALLTYIVSMAALFRIRGREAAVRADQALVSSVPRSSEQVGGAVASAGNAPGGFKGGFRSPGYPYSPAFALLAAAVCLATMIYYNRVIAAVFAGVLLAGCGWFSLASARRHAAEAQAIAAAGLSEAE